MYALIDYPADLPCVEVDGYSLSLDAGVLRDGDEQAFSHQRRAFNNMPTTVQGSVKLSTTNVANWLYWMNVNGFDWFGLRIAHMWMLPGNLTEVAAVRLISDGISLDYQSFNVVIARFQLELSPSVYATGIVAPDSIFFWVVGGTPATPSTNWYIAGTPANPSLERTIVAGTPSNPNALMPGEDIYSLAP